MNKQTKRWQILGKLSKSKTKESANENIVDTLLNNRGLDTKKKKDEFFNPPDPETISLKDLKIKKNEVDKGILRIKKAWKTKEKVIIYGDYDADGICGTAILWEALYKIGLNVLPYIPERFSEGYGLNAGSVKNLKLKIKNLKLIITVDNGITAKEEIEKINKLGIDVIITDHHLPGKVKPRVFAIIHTTLIGGAAVAWIFSREIVKKFKQTNYSVQESLDLAAIGTISDQLLLMGFNRSIVKHGLEKLNKTKRSGLLALFEEARIRPGGIGPYEVGFIIAPRINAMGRLTHAIDSLRLLCTRDKDRSRELAMHIGRTNLERQKIVDRVVIHAREKLGGEIKESVIVLAHEEYHEGVIGLAAAKLVEEFYRPAIVLSIKGDISKASARSISGFNIIETIRKLEGLYLEGGGHPMAAGFSIETKRIDEFKERLNKIAKASLTEEVLLRKLKIDLELQFNQINQELVDELRSFEPTGLGNPAPTFLSKNINVVNARLVGQNGKHLKLKLKQDSQAIEAIAFGQGDIYPMLNQEIKLDIAYSVEENIWNGDRSLQLKIKDIKIKP